MTAVSYMWKSGCGLFKESEREIQEKKKREMKRERGDDGERKQHPIGHGG